METTPKPHPTFPPIPAGWTPLANHPSTSLPDGRPMAPRAETPAPTPGGNPHQPDHRTFVAVPLTPVPTATPLPYPPPAASGDGGVTGAVLTVAVVFGVLRRVVG